MHSLDPTVPVLWLLQVNTTTLDSLKIFVLVRKSTNFPIIVIHTIASHWCNESNLLLQLHYYQIIIPCGSLLSLLVECYMLIISDIEKELSRYLVLQ